MGQAGQKYYQRLALDQPCELPKKFGIYSKDNEKALEKVLSREITESSS